MPRNSRPAKINRNNMRNPCELPIVVVRGMARSRGQVCRGFQHSCGLSVALNGASPGLAKTPEFRNRLPNTISVQDSM